MYPKVNTVLLLTAVFPIHLELIGVRLTTTAAESTKPPRPQSIPIICISNGKTDSTTSIESILGEPPNHTSVKDVHRIPSRLPRSHPHTDYRYFTLVNRMDEAASHTKYQLKLHNSPIAALAYNRCRV